MKMKNPVSLIVVSLAGLTSLTSGFTENRVELTDTGVINLEQRSTGKVYIAWSGAYGQDDGFVTAGVLRRRDRVVMPIRAHVDVTVLSPDGIILDEALSSDVYVSRRIAGRSYLSFERFKVCLEPIQITRYIALDRDSSKFTSRVNSGCKARCLRCRPKTFSTWQNHASEPFWPAALASDFSLGLITTRLFG